MDDWNFIYLAMGIGGLISILNTRKVNFEIYLNKLERKYGIIDRKKIIKLNNYYCYFLSMVFILVGLLTKEIFFARIFIVTTIIVCTIAYYLIRKIYCCR